MRLTKVLLLSVAVGLIATMHALGQGIFDFRNLADAPVFDSAGNRLDGPRYRAAMYAGFSEDSLSFVAETPFLSGDRAGYFNGRWVTVTGIFPGQLALIQVTAWDTALGPTFESVRSLGIGGYGEANPFSTPAGGEISNPATLPFPWSQLESFSLRPVIPEPSAFWLLAGGLPFLWLFTRGRRGNTSHASCSFDRP